MATTTTHKLLHSNLQLLTTVHWKGSRNFQADKDLHALLQKEVPAVNVIPHTYMWKDVVGHSVVAACLIAVVQVVLL